MMFYVAEHLFYLGYRTHKRQFVNRRPAQKSELGTCRLGEKASPWTALSAATAGFSSAAATAPGAATAAPVASPDPARCLKPAALLAVGHRYPPPR
jgi:hypothetical protein